MAAELPAQKQKAEGKKKKQKIVTGRQADVAITAAAAPAGTVNTKAKRQKPARPAEIADGDSQPSTGAEKRKSSIGASAQPPKAEQQDASSKPAANADEPPRKRRRRSNKQRAEEEASLTPEERLRRLHQRERQELARRLQVAGRPYKRQKRQALEAAKPAQPKPADRGGKKEPPITSGTRPDHAVQVIIVPIFWLKREKECKEVIAAAERVGELLLACGIDAGVDSTAPMSPGQKFRHWEMQGVKLRLEIGPKEAEQGGCILAVCTTPGEVAAKTTLQIGKKLLDEVRGHLSLPAGDGATDAAQLEKHSKAQPDRAAGGSRPGQAAISAQLSGAKPAGTHVVFSGDDLADDFQTDEPAEPAPTRKKKKAAPAPNGQLPAVVADAREAKKRKKVVKF